MTPLQPSAAAAGLQGGLSDAGRTAVELAQADIMRASHPDMRPFTGLDDVCDRLLPYHVFGTDDADEDGAGADRTGTGVPQTKSQAWHDYCSQKVAGLESSAAELETCLAYNGRTNSLLPPAKHAAGAAGQATTAAMDSASEGDEIVIRAPLSEERVYLSALLLLDAAATYTELRRQLTPAEPVPVKVEPGAGADVPVIRSALVASRSPGP